MLNHVSRLCLLIGLAWTIFAPATGRADYALRDGDTVVFLGDSITAARTYGKIIENYTLLRFPERKVTFINSGRGGDTAVGGLRRLDRDVFAHGATVLIVAYGINDIGWGTKADDEHRQLYLEAIRGIVMACKARGIRVFVCSAAITAEDPDKARGGFLEQMCDAGMAIAREEGQSSIDVMRSMRAAQRKVIEANAHAQQEKDKTSLHTTDGVHLNDLGQLAMAFAILKGIGAPAEVSSVAIDASRPAVTSAEGCKVSSLEGDTEELKFDRLDDGLPLNLGLFRALQFRFVPVHEELNHYMLTVTGLPAEHKYEMVVNDRSLGTFTADQLQKGANISHATANGWVPGGPWDAQAWALAKLSDARGELAASLSEIEEFQPLRAAADLAKLRRQTASADAELVSLQRSLVAPRPFHFVIRPAAEDKP